MDTRTHADTRSGSSVGGRHLTPGRNLPPAILGLLGGLGITAATLVILTVGAGRDLLVAMLVGAVGAVALTVVLAASYYGRAQDRADLDRLERRLAIRERAEVTVRDPRSFVKVDGGAA